MPSTGCRCWSLIWSAPTPAPPPASLRIFKRSPSICATQVASHAHGLGLTEMDRQDLSRLNDPQRHQEKIA